MRTVSGFCWSRRVALRTVAIAALLIVSPLAPRATAGTLVFQLDPAQPLAGQAFDVVLPNGCLVFTGGYQVDYPGSTVRITLDTPDVIFCQPGGPFPDLRVAVNAQPAGTHPLEFYGRNTSGTYFIHQSTIEVLSPDRTAIQPIPTGSMVAWIALFALLAVTGAVQLGSTTWRAGG